MSPSESLMSYGFACGDGWAGLLISLSEKIMKLNPEGTIRVDQVKEKYGGLRFYYGGSTPTKEIAEKILKVIGEAEQNSYKVCEECGAKGNLRKDLPWIQTLCDKCYKTKVEYRRIKK
jgi:NMD protein affecting ribosome stability and mRNA decay